MGSVSAGCWNSLPPLGHFEWHRPMLTRALSYWYALYNFPFSKFVSGCDAWCNSDVSRFCPRVRRIFPFEKIESIKPLLRKMSGTSLKKSRAGEKYRGFSSAGILCYSTFHARMPLFSIIKRKTMPKSFEALMLSSYSVVIITAYAPGLPPAHVIESWPKSVKVGCSYKSKNLFVSKRGERARSNINALVSLQWRALCHESFSRISTLRRAYGIRAHVAQLTTMCLNHSALGPLAYWSPEVWIVMSCHLEPIFCVLDVHLRVAQVEYQGQIRYTRILDRKNFNR